MRFERIISLSHLNDSEKAVAGRLNVNGIWRYADIESVNTGLEGVELLFTHPQPAPDENSQMLALAEHITASAHPEEDARLEIAYAIARYLKLDWPSAYDLDHAFCRIDTALAGLPVTVEEEQTLRHLRALLTAAPQPASEECQ